MVATDSIQPFHRYKRWIPPFIKKNLFLPGFYTQKPLKTVTFTLKKKILGSKFAMPFTQADHLAFVNIWFPHFLS